MHVTFSFFIPLFMVVIMLSVIAKPVPNLEDKAKAIIDFGKRDVYRPPSPAPPGTAETPGMPTGPHN
ncbi:hypothetical protein PGTUg99_032791 [Puccinia graminis f. sp. tritici]|uniref:Uncharacterized protein n=1 Tax=Puccinia graminis f. sp. tritici TaxID=56615 RepID=A0A5B0RW15_PUCGR|nr:hypothetical protein PGTUg99_032791 [Puccinia graminis f. sp. tritici]